MCTNLHSDELLLNSSYAWQYLALDSLEQSATTCRDVRNLISQTELVDTSYRVTTTDERECTLLGSFSDCLSDCLRTTSEVVELKYTGRTVPEDSLSTLDGSSNYLGLREAEKRISTTKLAVEQADEDYRIAQLRYMSGVGTNTDVLDAQVALTQAKTNYTKALYDYNTSKTALETSIGVPMSNPATAVKVQAAKTAKAVKAAEEKTEEAAK